jgi:hypothetical protein
VCGKFCKAFDGDDADDADVVHAASTAQSDTDRGCL